jgi:hypothetical protein
VTRPIATSFTGRVLWARAAGTLLWCLLATRTPAAADPRPAPGHAERVEYRDPATAPARGPANAPVTIEVFLVPSPPMPVAALRMLQQLADHHPARIRLVYRILKGSTLLQAPSAALEAHAEGKFFEMMDELSKQRNALKREDVLELARKVGVDPQRVAQAIQFDHYREVLDANQHRLDRLHAGNAPSVLFNARPTKVGPAGFSMPELEREYEAAYDRALDKLDRGFAPRDLGSAFDDEAMSGTQPVVLTAGMPDDDPDRSPLDHPLATPPLQLDGLPSFGKPGVTAAVPVVVLCRPNDPGCGGLLRTIESETGLYPDDVRIVWAPWFDVSLDNATELTLLGDAALCAEKIGSNQGALTTSPGWAWIKEMYTQAGKFRGRRLLADKLIDAVAAKLDVNARILSACRATMASSSLTWIAAARHAGVQPRANVAVVIGGRIYDGLVDQTMIHALVEAELAPGVLGSLPRWHTGK